MAEYSAYDVLGPIMVGPSSSHTAGACKIGNVAKKICKDNFKSVEFLLHGSFAHTYKGHGTDKALVGGILGFETDDDNIKRSFEIAKERGIAFSFKPINLGDDFHPNTVKIIFHYDDCEEYVIGSSIGGGAIVIVDINGITMEFRGQYPTILLKYNEQRGIISFVSSLLNSYDYNIESIVTNKNSLTNIVTLTVEIDRFLSDDLKTAIFSSNKFLQGKYIEV